MRTLVAANNENIRQYESDVREMGRGEAGHRRG